VELKICFVCRNHNPSGFFTRVARRVSLLNQKLIILPGTLEFTPGSFSSIFSFVCNMVLTIGFFFIFFLLAIVKFVLSVLLRIMDYNYPFGNFLITHVSKDIVELKGLNHIRCLFDGV